MNVAWLAPLLLAAGENRLWWVELEVRGPCAEVTLDCGADGATRLAGPFPAGEERTLEVPVPVRSPLGAGGLTAVPLPTARALPEADGGAVRVVRWSPRQPAASVEGTLADLALLPHPPPRVEIVHAGRGELALVLVAGVVLLALRRRAGPALVVGLLAGGGAFLLARGRAAGPGTVRWLDWRGGSALGLAGVAGSGEVPLPAERLELVPEGGSVHLSLDASGAGTARAEGARLAALTLEPAPELTSAASPLALAAVWTRAPDGAWRARTPWERGRPLGPETEGGAPPGWASGGLPPGRALLLARTPAGRWLRCLDFALGARGIDAPRRGQ